MNPFGDLVIHFQELVARVPELVQPLIVTVAAAIPFIEAEGAAMIGVIGGVNPFVAGIAAAIGNFLAVLVVVAVSSRARAAAMRRRGSRSTAVAEGAGGVATLTAVEVAPAKPESKGRARFKKWLVRFGVPGASILGPLAIPTHFTSAILIASGTARGWVLLWQGVAIVLWTTVTTVSGWLALHFLILA
ncbi:small multidrug efflux protein [Microbacterium sp. JZ31]|uniref:small multidrug efflux protein n=1 Tax=Microbacterium sp. JZ31 TaxID=1906274 RepID=UPI00300C399A